MAPKVQGQMSNSGIGRELSGTSRGFWCGREPDLRLYWQILALWRNISPLHSILNACGHFFCLSVSLHSFVTY
jgi:hypothetical protein